MALGLSSFEECGILLDQGSNPCPFLRQVDSNHWTTRKLSSVYSPPLPFLLQTLGRRSSPKVQVSLPDFDLGELIDSCSSFITCLCLAWKFDFHLSSVPGLWLFLGHLDCLVSSQIQYVQNVIYVNMTLLKLRFP